jgi:hypothetical protein
MAVAEQHSAGLKKIINKPGGKDNYNTISHESLINDSVCESP